MTFSRCGGNAGGGSFEIEELDANSLEDDVDAMLERDSRPVPPLPAGPPGEP